MSTQTFVPAFTPAEARMRSSFLALMWALSYPGRAQQLPIQDAGEAFPVIIETLLDLETSYYTPGADVAIHCQRSMARAEQIPQAEYLFFPALTQNDLPPLASASVGTMLYPDRAATLVLGGILGTGLSLQLCGPGIQGMTVIQIGAFPHDFWMLREQMRRYPLGWDIFVVSGTQVIGLPRSTAIEVR